MALDALHSFKIVEALEGFLERRRPPEHMRSKLDLGYRIDKQSVILFELRPVWGNPEVIRESPFAKASWIHSRKKLETLLDAIESQVVSLPDYFSCQHH